MRLLFDIETDGLLDSVSRIHCLVIEDLDTQDLKSYGDSPLCDGSLAEGLNRLQQAEFLAGHNIMDYDIPVLWKLHGITFNCELWDTLVVSKLIWPEIKEKDFRLIQRGFPKKLIGRHSLEAWGHRLGMHKGDYAQIMKDQGLDPWAQFCPEMLDYCIQDVRLNCELYRRQIKHEPSQRAVDIEHLVHGHCLKQTEYGVGFDSEAAGQLYAKWTAERAEVEAELRQVFGCWYMTEGTTEPKRDNKKTGLTKGVPYTKLKLVEFNPGSRDHISLCLKRRYGWEPEAFTNGGKAQVDESVLGKLKYPEAQLLTKYLLLQKRIGQLAEGDNAWLKKVKPDGRIHGRVNTNGAVTGRATHLSPNLAQVPRVGTEGGAECRALFIPSRGWVLVGADASGLELRCLGHYLAAWDGGAYIDLVLNGDIHTANQKAAGLPTRNDAKTFIYAWLYGAGDEKIGSIIGKGSKAGKAIKAKFMEALPAFKHLIAAIKKKVEKQGYLVGLDGRKLHVRSAHSALNTLLQSAGAIIMKQAMVNFHRNAAAAGYVDGKDYRQVLWIHDEFQVECRPDIAQALGSIMVEAIKKVTHDFNFRCPLDGEFKVGANWKETH